MKNQEVESNSINIKYFILGENKVNALIQNFSLDKDYYESGEVAKVSLFWNSSSETDINLNLNIKSKNKECITPLNQNVKGNGYLDLEIPIISDCKNPQVFISLKTLEGENIIEKAFSIQTDKKNLEKTGVLDNNNFMIAAAFVLIAMAIVVYFINLKKKENEKNIQ